MRQAELTTARRIAFLRAINVGGHTVKMDALRALFTGLGLGGVETFIASGNVIFDAPDAPDQELEAQIAAHLRQALGYDVATFIRSPGELAAVVGYEPFARADIDAPEHRLYVGFLHAPPGDAAQARALGLRTAVDDLHIHGREIYWLCRIRSSDSEISGATLEKALGGPATLRNITTVRKLAAKYPAHPTAAR